MQDEAGSLYLDALGLPIPLPAREAEKLSARFPLLGTLGARPIARLRVAFIAAFASGLAAALTAPAAHAELFLDLGAQTARLSSKIANQSGNIESTDSSLHVGFGFRRAMPSGRGALAVRLEADEIGNDLFLAVRPLDYRRNISERLAWTGFFGVARLALGTPAYGWYAGGGLQVKEVLPSWDLGIDLRYGDHLARDNILPSDPKGGSPDNFHSVAGLSVYLSRRF